jgi:hypothetical protein
LTGKLPTKIYVTDLSDRLRLIYILRGGRDDSDGHHQNREDSSARGFLEDLAIQLSPQAIFQPSFVAQQQKGANEGLSLPLLFPDVDLSLEGESTELLQDYVHHIKDAFGLRPVSPLLGESSRSRGLSIGRHTPSSPRRLLRQQQQLNSKMDFSAVALFLGPELGRYLC